MSERGYILHEGSSKIDGRDIVVIATMKTSNRKTGNMVQVWILDANVNPVESYKLGLDRSICGDCIHRGTNGKGRSCYVNLGQAPLAIYRAYKKGVYKKLPSGMISIIFSGKKVRFGAYGDPVLIPLNLVELIAKVASSHTGYTHQWKKTKYQAYKLFFMASCDSIGDEVIARANGWRRFRVLSKESEKMSDAIECPSDSKGIQCSACTLCKGASIAAKSIWINAHGSGAKYVSNS